MQTERQEKKESQKYDTKIDSLTNVSLFKWQNFKRQFNIDGLVQVGFIQSISGSGFEVGLETQQVFPG